MLVFSQGGYGHLIFVGEGEGEVERKKKKKEEAEREAAGKRFIANMKKVVFISTYLLDLDIELSPCFCCKKKMQKTCPHTVGEPNCKDYVLYSDSPQKVERKVLDFVSKTKLQRSRLRRLAA